MAEGEITNVIYRGDVVVVTGHSNALNRAVAADQGGLGGGVRAGCSQILPLGVDFNVEAADDQSHAAAARPRHAGRA